MDWCESSWSCTGNAKNHFHPFCWFPISFGIEGFFWFRGFFCFFILSCSFFCLHKYGTSLRSPSYLSRKVASMFLLGLFRHISKLKIKKKGRFQLMRETAICPLFKRSTTIITLSGTCKALGGEKKRTAFQGSTNAWHAAMVNEQGYYIRNLYRTTHCH